MYTRISLLTCLFAVLLAACGLRAKHHDDAGETNAPDDGKALKINPVALRLSTSDASSALNEAAADITGKDKVQATFELKADSSYNLRLASLKNDFSGCLTEPAVPVLRWIEGDPAKATEIKLNDTFAAARDKSYTLTVEFDNSARCARAHFTFVVAANQIDTPTSTPAPSGTPGDRNFSHFVLVRELGDSGTDSAALFIVLPTPPAAMSVKDVKGPSFLCTAKVGTVDDSSITKFFAKSSHPLSAEGRQRLLEYYRGAAFVYFEGYTGRLCDGKAQAVIFTSQLEDGPWTTVFKFVGSSNDQGLCTMSASAMVTAKGSDEQVAAGVEIH